MLVWVLLPVLVRTHPRPVCVGLPVLVRTHLILVWVRYTYARLGPFASACSYSPYAALGPFASACSYSPYAALGPFASACSYSPYAALGRLPVLVRTHPMLLWAVCQCLFVLTLCCFGPFASACSYSLSSRSGYDVPTVAEVNDQAVG